MTTHADHRIWQDVYKVVNQNRPDAYLKLTVIDDVLIVFFQVALSVKSRMMFPQR
jgi:motility quorum-sensing regulator/GCU-specific mRNA interferase toxin